MATRGHGVPCTRGGHKHSEGRGGRASFDAMNSGGEGGTGRAAAAMHAQRAQHTAHNVTRLRAPSRRVMRRAHLLHHQHLRPHSKGGAWDAREVVLSTQSHLVQQQSARRWRETQTKGQGAMEHSEKSCTAYLRLQVGQEQRQCQHRPREPPGSIGRGPGPARGRSGRHVNAPGTARGHTPPACGNASQHLVVVWGG